jgi:hypothetical protein
VPSAMDLMGEVAALSVKQSMGIDVGDEARDILRRCDTEDDKRVIMRQFESLGIPYPNA